MAGQRPGAFPLLVRGDWASAEPPAALRKKLLCYFQSQKRSGGGECELRSGAEPGQILVCFARHDVKQRVLERQSHKLYLGEKKELKLIVTEPETALAAKEEAFGNTSVPTEALDATSSPQTKGDAESLQEAKSELQEGAGSVESISEKPADTSPLVVFENIQGCSLKCLRMLLENVSGLAVNEDFTVEVVPEVNAAVVTFIKSIDTEEFLQRCSQNKRVKEFRMSARLLEPTQRVRVEKVPASASADYLGVYFESARSGGGPVTDVQLLPDDGAALVTFCRHADVQSVLKKQHFLEKTQICVYPYYQSLGTALYGAARPAVRVPDPFGVPLDPHVWQFLQQQAGLMHDIEREMAVCHCELKWPQGECGHPEALLCPSPSLSKQKKSVVKLVRTWKQDASAEFSRIMARYGALKCQVNSVDWEEVKSRLVKELALSITDVAEGVVVIAGTRAAVDGAEKEVRQCMEKAMEQSERQRQSIEISVSVAPGRYVVLQHAGIEDSVHKDYPCLKIFYDGIKKTVQLCGLPAEVYKVKADLLEKVMNMPRASVVVDPHLLYYLQHVDNKTMSETLFTKEKINAFYELEDNTVSLFGDAPKDLLEAEKQIKTGLDYECIDVEDGEVIKKKEWRSLLDSLHKKYNSSQETVVFDEPVEKENQVTVAGFSKAVREVSDKLKHFIDRNTRVEKVIPAKSVVAVEFTEKEKSGVCLELRKKGVTVRFDTKAPCVSLSGPRAEVPQAAAVFEELLSSLYSKNVSIDKPGAREFFTERKDLCVFEAKQKFDCLIRLAEEQQQEGEEVGDKDKRKLHYRKILPGGVVLEVYRGNLCTHPVDVVVNASNEDLKHIGGLAGALLDAAGPELQRECDELVRRNGRLQPGCAVITGAGKLPCKNVVHAVGPRWREDEAEKCMYLLRKTVRKSLQLADTFNHSSIALPAVSAGIFGFPLEPCARSIVLSLKETLEGLLGDSSLKEVHLVDDAEETVQMLSETVKKVFEDKTSSSPEPLPQERLEKQRPRRSRKEKGKEELQMDRDDLLVVTTNEGLCIRLKKNNIQEAKTDVVVNSVGVDLQFGVGPLCRALLKTAGPELQVEFDEAAQSQGAVHGSVLCTSGYSLACRTVLHAILSVWDGRGQTLQILEDIIEFCLKKTEELGLKSITFPAIGTGGFGFPKTIVSKLMFDVVYNLSSSCILKTVQEVHFILNPKDIDNIQAFTTELQRRVPESGHAVAAQPGLTTPVSAEALGVHEMQVGSITLQVLSGDITKEDTEVIVNISNATFDATSGVFRAIMDAAGSQVEDECAEYAEQSHGGFITTQGGNLSCSKIIHLVHNSNVKRQVTKVLSECELRMYKSVAFPAIGTGQAGQSPAKVADDMLDAIVEFAAKQPVQHLKKIKIIIFQTNMLRDFYESMKRREDRDLSTTDSWMSLFKSFFLGKKTPTEKKKPITLEKKVDEATFQICGNSKSKVEAAESWLKDIILKEQFENSISDELIENFDESQIKALSELQKTKQVTIQLENKLSPPCIKISGISRDVCFVSVEVQKMIQKLKDTEEERSKAELVRNLVEWRYLLSNGKVIPFDKLTNMQLEDAKIAKKTHLTVKIKKSCYKVDLNTLQATDEQGRTINIQRVPKNEDKQSIELPAHWEDMKKERVKLVTLNPLWQEYVDVQSRFQQTCPSYVIEKIERVQNPFLWQTYQIKKKSLCTKNKSQKNEKLLFHGTAATSLSTINYNGFNRGFAGRNAAAIGNGTYFAVDASYSAQDAYASPDLLGRRYMYQARVLTGQYCVGSRGLITPPPKNPADPTDLYDSVVDNDSNPTMFVIFNDIQAYPEYLITFRK